MFTTDDFWSIFKVLKDNITDADLDINTKILAESEQGISRKLFLNILDQACHMSNDYKRLRPFLIDWYTSHRTITSTQKNISDVYSLPSSHVSELIKSFGFEYGLNLVPLRNKVSLFLDLVNLYKKKGTPEALADILDYFGFSDADIIEYWLEKDTNNELKFVGRSIRRSATGSTTLLQEDIAFDNMVSDDPHWMMTEQQVLQGIENNDINLPSKSPYFSLSSIFFMARLQAAAAILSRVVIEEYNRKVVNGLELFKNISIKSFSGIYSLLEIYVGTLYVFERMFGYNTTNDTKYSCFNGTVQWSTGSPPSLINLDQLMTQYETLVTTVPIDRDDRKTRIQTLINDWTRPVTSHFITGPGQSESLLTIINPSFKQECDIWFSQQQQDYLILYLIGALDKWIRVNIDSKIPSWAVTVLGFGFREEVSKIIDFFKPYRARLAFLDTAYSINNPLSNSIRLDEGDMELILYQYATDHYEIQDEDLHMVIYQNLVDSFQVNCSGDLFYDTGNIYDLVGCWYDETDYIITQILQDTVQPTDQLITQHEWTYDGDYPRGMQGPAMWDMGGSFDTPVQAPIVDDRDHVEIIPWPPFPEEEITITFIDLIRGEAGPPNWDLGHQFDTPMQAGVCDDRDNVIVDSFIP